MRKFIALIAFATLSFASQAQSKIGTIDADYILSQMAEIEEVNKGLEVYSAELQKDLDTTITNYEKEIKEYQEKGGNLSEEARKTQEQEIITLENDIKSFRQKATVMLQMKRSELTEPLFQQINSAMMEVIEEEGYTQVFHSASNALAYSREADDITLKVMAKMGIKAE